MYEIKQITENGPDKGRWYWMQMVSSHGLVQGVSDTEKDAQRDLKLAWYDLENS